MARSEQERVYAYLAKAYKQEFGITPAEHDGAVRRLKEAALFAVACYRGTIIDDVPIVIHVPYAYAEDVLHPRLLTRTLTRDEFQKLLEGSS